MKLKAKLVIMSHLSDAQESIGVGMSQESANRHINFVKYLIMYCGNDLEQEIDPDKMYEMYLDRHLKQ